MKCITCMDRGYVFAIASHLRELCPACRQPSQQPPPQAGAVRDEGNVRILRNVTSQDLPPERILAAASDAGLKLCIVVGELPDGEFYFASNQASGPEVLWALERAKLALLRAGGAA